MGVFDALNQTSNKAIDSGEEYFQTTKDYYKLKVFQQLTKSFSTLAKVVIIGSLFFLGLIFITVAGAIWLGKLVGSIILSCLLIAGILFICALVGYLLRKKIDKYVIRKTSKEFFD
ncbi:hypothetical protein ACWGOQ_0007065 [Aquimarina sp. M1]